MCRKETLMKQILVFLSFILAIFSFGQRTDAYIELNAFYIGDSFNVGSTSTSSRMFVEGSLGFAIDRKSHYLIGWNYGMHTISEDANSVSSSYSSTQMGPRFIWFFTRSKSWSLGFAYNLVTKSEYKSGTNSTESWSGTAFKVDLGYNFAIGDSSFLGVRLNYSSATYTSKLVGSTDYSEISNSVTSTYPSVYFIYLW